MIRWDTRVINSAGELFEGVVVPVMLGSWAKSKEVRKHASTVNFH